MLPHPPVRTAAVRRGYRSTPATRRVVVAVWAATAGAAVPTVGASGGRPRSQALARAVPFEGRIVLQSRSEAGPPTMVHETELLVGHGRVRARWGTHIVGKPSPVVGGELTTYLDVPARTVYSVNPSLGMYGRAPMPDPAAAAVPVQYTALGRAEVVAGVRCTVYRLRTPGVPEVEGCFADRRDLALPTVPGVTSAPGVPPTLGFPLRTVGVAGPGAPRRSETRVVRIERRAVPLAAVTPPPHAYVEGPPFAMPRGRGAPP